MVCAIGLRQVMRVGAGAVWGPRLVGAVAAGLVLAGVFPTDPALGYPPGTGEKVSLAGGVHQLGGTLLYVGLIGACFVWGRRFVRSGESGWALYSRTTGAAVTLLAVGAGVVYRLVQKDVLTTGPAGALELASFVLGFAWITIVVARTARQLGAPQRIP